MKDSMTSFNNKSNKTIGNSKTFKIKTPFKPCAFFFLTLHFSGDICHQIMELYLSGSIYLLIKLASVSKLCIFKFNIVLKQYQKSLTNLLFHSESSFSLFKQPSVKIYTVHNISSIISHEYVVQNLENENKIKLNFHTTVRCSPIWKIFLNILL